MLGLSSSKDPSKCLSLLAALAGSLSPSAGFNVPVRQAAESMSNAEAASLPVYVGAKKPDAASAFAKVSSEDTQQGPALSRTSLDERAVQMQALLCAGEPRHFPKDFSSSNIEDLCCHCTMQIRMAEGCCMSAQSA